MTQSNVPLSRRRRAVVAVAVLGYQLCDAKKQPKGVQLNIGERDLDRDQIARSNEHAGARKILLGRVRACEALAEAGRMPDRVLCRLHTTSGFLRVRDRRGEPTFPEG